MEAQDGGGALKKREIGTSEECFICESPSGGRILCSVCGRLDGRSHLATGDLPMIFCMVFILLSFVLTHMEEGQPFHMKGLALPGSRWALLLLVLGIIFPIIDLLSDPVTLKRSAQYKALHRTLLPLLFIAPLSFLFPGAPVTFTVLAVVAGVVVVGITLFLNRRNVLKTPVNEMVLLSLSAVVAFTGMVHSVNGNPSLFGVDLFYAPALVPAGIFGVFVFSVRVNRNASMLARSRMVSWMLLITVVLGLSALLYSESGGSAPLSGFLWWAALVSLAVSLSAGYLKRSMDHVLHSAYSLHDEQQRRLENLRDTDPAGYGLYLLDSAIMYNPVHGFGEEKGSSSTIFEIEGPEGETSIIMEPNEYVRAHCEKGRSLASRGRFQEAFREYSKAISIGPDHQRSYYHRAFLRAVLPGGGDEASKDLDIYLASRRLFISRLAEDGLSRNYLFVMSDLYDLYSRAVRKKAEMMSDPARSGDIGSYFTMVRD